MNPNDPDVIALSKAIFQHESGGNFNAVGDAGTSHGAGQWQEGTWKAQAKDVLGDENAQMTPANQKAVIQVSIAKDKAAGLNPAQIAAKWNSGSPTGWENKVGTTTINGQAIHYDVPKYVKDVTDLYHQYKGQNIGGTNTPQDDSQESESLGSKLEGRVNKVGGAIGLAGQGAQEALGGHVGRGLFDIGSGALQSVGQLAGGVGDAIGAGIGLIPGAKAIEGLIGKGVSKVADTGAGQAVIGAGQDFAAKHPVVAGDLGAIGNIGGLVAGGVGGKVAKDAVEEGVVAGARKGILGGVVKGAAEKSATKQAEELLSTDATKSAVKSAVRSGRITTEGGIPGIADDPLKQASVKEVSRAIMEGKIPKGLVSDKAGAIKKTADDMAIELENNPALKTAIVQPEEIDGILNNAVKEMGEDPTMVGNAEESAKRILNKFKSFLPQDREITAQDVLKARKSLDSWIGGLSGGSNVFDPAYENAKTIALRAIRQGANGLVADKVPDVAVKELLQRQSALYRALDYLTPKVKDEIGTTKLDRFTKKHPRITGLVKGGAKAALIGAGAKGFEELI